MFERPFWPMRDQNCEFKPFSNHRHIIQQFITLTNEIPAWTMILTLTMDDLSDNGRLIYTKDVCLSEDFASDWLRPFYLIIKQNCSLLVWRLPFHISLPTYELNQESYRVTFWGISWPIMCQNLETWTFWNHKPLSTV